MRQYFLVAGLCLAFSFSLGCQSSTVVKQSGTGGSGAGGHGAGGMAGTAGAGGSPADSGTGGSGRGGSGSGGSPADSGAGGADSGSGGFQCGADAGCSGSGCIQTLYDGESKPGPLYVDDSLAYWIANGTATSLRAGPKSGGCVAKTLIPDLHISGTVTELLGDTDALYLATTDPAQTVVKIDKSTDKKSVLVGPNDCAQGGDGLIAQNATYIVFVCKDSGGLVERTLKTGGSLPDIVFTPPTPAPYYGLAADDTFAYIDDGSIGKQNLDGSGGKELFNDSAATGGMVLGDQLYWLKVGGELWQGGIITFLESARDKQLVDPQVLAADKKGAFVADMGTGPGDGRIVAAPVGKGGVAVLASKENHPTAIASDVAYVYWTNQNGTVRRTARP